MKAALGTDKDLDRQLQGLMQVSNRADGMPFSDPEGLYFGPLDAQGRPHGYGELRIDSSESILNRFQGEFRDGEMWEGIMIDWTEDVEKPNLAAIQTADILGYYHAVMREGAWVENPSQEALESASAKMKRAEQAPLAGSAGSAGSAGRGWLGKNSRPLALTMQQK